MAASGWWMLSGLHRPGCADRQLLNTCWQHNIVTKGSQLSAHNISEVTRQTHFPCCACIAARGWKGLQLAVAQLHGWGLAVVQCRVHGHQGWHA